MTENPDQQQDVKQVTDARAADLVTRGLTKQSGQQTAAPQKPAAAPEKPNGAAAAAPPTSVPEGYVKADDVQRMIREAITQQQQQTTADNVRTQFIAKLHAHSNAPVPNFVVELLPQTSDVKVLEKKWQDIQGEMREMVNGFIERGVYRVNKDGVVEFNDIGGASRDGGMTLLQAMETGQFLDRRNASPSSLVGRALKPA